MHMMQYDTYSRSHRLALKRPVTGPPTHPPGNYRTDKQLTAPADRPVSDAAKTVAFTTAVAVGGADMRAAPAHPGDRKVILKEPHARAA